MVQMDVDLPAPSLIDVMSTPAAERLFSIALHRWQKGVFNRLSTSQNDSLSGPMVKYLRLNRSFWFKTVQTNKVILKTFIPNQSLHLVD